MNSAIAVIMIMIIVPVVVVVASAAAVAYRGRVCRLSALSPKYPSDALAVL